MYDLLQLISMENVLQQLKFHSSTVETMEEIAASVSCSSRGGHNIPQLVEDPQKPVHFYDWQAFFRQIFKPIPHLKKYHHFRYFPCSFYSLYEYGGYFLENKMTVCFCFQPI